MRPQPSALLPQVTQAEPAQPQLVVAPVFAMQLPPAVAVQQPPGQEVLSQTHWPLRQRCWPEMHGELAPQWQTPLAQLSPVPFKVQSTHVEAWPPQAVVVGVWHWLFLQQPLAQEVASHTHWPLKQCWPEAHSEPLPQLHWPFWQPSARVMSQETQATPLRPHEAKVGGSTQVLPLQQPLAQEPEVQRHWPLTHDWFGPQIGLLPQRQVPVSQWSARF
jgi:hypothetical protein